MLRQFSRLTCAPLISRSINSGPLLAHSHKRLLLSQNFPSVCCKAEDHGINRQCNCQQTQRGYCLSTSEGSRWFKELMVTFDVQPGQRIISKSSTPVMDVVSSVGEGGKTAKSKGKSLQISQMIEFLVEVLLTQATEIQMSDLEVIQRKLEALSLPPSTTGIRIIWPSLMLTGLTAHPTHENCLKVAQLLLEYARQRGECPMIGPYVNYINLLEVCGGQDDLMWKTYKELCEDYPFPDGRSLHVLIRCLSHTSHYEECFRLKKLHEKFVGSLSVTAYGHLFSGLMHSGEYERALALLDEIGELKREPVDAVYQSAFSDSAPLNVGYVVLELMTKYEWILPSRESALTVKDWLDRQQSPRWKTRFSFIRGKHCSGCSKEMEEAVLSDDEFNLLKTACLEKVLQKSDPFQSTTPEELAKFEAFMADSEPFDLVIDGLNVSHKQGFKLRRSERLLTDLIRLVHSKLRDEGRTTRTLILGRHHFKNEINIDHVKRQFPDVTFFLSSNMSDDDPFAIYSAMHFGPNTYILTRDELRNHRYATGEDVQPIMAKWQRTRQITFMVNSYTNLADIQMPKVHRLCVSESDDSLHVPFSLGFKRKSYEPFENWICAKKLQAS